MPAGDKPFVMYRRGPMHFTIVPRGPKGWAQFAVWLALLVPLVLWFTGYVDNPDHAEDFGSAVFLFLFGIAGWLICGLWWMGSHAETVDVVVLRREQQAQRRKRERQLRQAQQGQNQQGQSGGQNG
ncbi:hypothetical protein [Erythrobacter colymbi]|uniref:hypothetical protein n=1 Tax=Erythrobacter colymbi TaxID=1161202 RepID=UPI000A36EA2C|nr:hypothetical protein [Erythrobacter colymbi]